VRTERSRKKKLIVAFHFQLGNKAAWNCDACRKSGLEKKRRCGWLANDADAIARVVWVRGRVSLTTCPTSYITAESIALLEEFNVWKLLGAGSAYDLPARLVEAIFVLENELRATSNDGQK
jgi:adenosine deaminase